MLHSASHPSAFHLILPLLSLIPCSSPSHGYLNPHVNTHSPGFFVPPKAQRGNAIVLSRRWLTENNEDQISNDSSLILAQERTTRKDPSDGFKYYTGGWNISNSHYWASVGFTAVPLFLISAIWLVLFGISLCIICLVRCCCCGRRESYGYSRAAYALSLILLILFTVTTGVGCFVLFNGQRMFHNKTSGTLDYIVSQADTVFETMENISQCLSSAKNVTVDSVLLPADVRAKIDDISVKVDDAASTLSSITTDNAMKIQQFLDRVRTSLIVVATAMLVLALLGFLMSVFGFQCIVYFLIILGWILVAGTFIFSGVFLLLHNVVADGCVAMDEWVENPTAHTALDDILPCLDNVTAQEAVVSTRDVTFQLVAVVNGVIENVSNTDFPPDAGPLYFNQSGPLVPLLCSPYGSDSTDRACSDTEVSLDNASQVWQGYECQISNNGICNTRGRLTPNLYTDMSAAVNVSYGLYHYAPFLADLVDCTFVRDTFADISRCYCPGLRRSSQWVYIGLVTVSSAVMLSLIFWVVYSRERRHPSHSRQFTTH